MGRYGSDVCLINVVTRIGPRNRANSDEVRYTDGPVFEITWDNGMRVTVVDSQTVHAYLDLYHAVPVGDYVIAMVKA
jgi:hypothetical protein